MESLIRSCFLHVDVIGPHVQEGRYDLVTNVPVAFSTDASFGPTPQAVLQPVGGQSSSTIVSPEVETVPVADTSVSEPALPQAPTPPPAVPSVPTPSTSIIILPELWEDLAEPGMYITMHVSNNSHPPALLWINGY